MFNDKAEIDAPFYSWRYAQYEPFFYFNSKKGCKLWDESIYSPPDRITML
ncbi:MAG: hypothetical protein PF541_05385 [Prolixibacteraceae bacterium]|nr:hypothetical protein [Prolixibacteraceae bacterium]